MLVAVFNRGIGKFWRNSGWFSKVSAPVAAA